jgi:glyoxylase-like metal-dependent hydrolase (beta-lactamase superfamily II)
MKQPLLTCALACGLIATTVGVRAQQNAAAISMLPVQGNVVLMTAGDTNVTVQTGKNGIVLVDTPAEALAPALLAEVRKFAPQPNVRYIINTSISAEHTGGNAAIVGPPATGRGTGGAPFGFAGLNRPNILAHENVLNRMSSATPPTPAAMLPTTEYFLPSMDIFANGEAIVLYHVPAAHTDGDTIAFFRRSDVISTGDIYTPGRYPVIDVARGGTVNGLILGLGKVLELAVPEAFEEGGTKIIPGHGRVSEETDVAEFRDMVSIIRDRVQDAMKKNQTLDQVKASRPSRDYDSEYHATQADADRLVESIYRTLPPVRPAAARPAGGRS